MPFENAAPSEVAKKPFHKRPLGIVLIIIGMLVGVGLIAFATLVLIFYRRMVAGEDLSYLAKKQEFTQSAALAARPVGEAEEALVNVVTDDDPTLGPPDAPLTVVEFIDFECPFCLKAFPIMRELTAKHPETIRYIVRDFPVAELHPDATLAGEAAACAHAQKRFWPYHDKLYQNQGALGKENLLSFGEQVGLDMDAFTSCVDSGEFHTEVEKDFNEGIAAGVRGSPTFFINGQKFQGVIPEEVWDQLLTLVEIAE